MSELLKSIVDPLRDSASVRSVFGEPISANGRTIIPVARIAYGFGGGSRTRSGDQAPGEGGGGGGMAGIPLGVIEITAGGTRFIPLNDKVKLSAACIAGFCLGMFWAKHFTRHRE